MGSEFFAPIIQFVTASFCLLTLAGISGLVLFLLIRSRLDKTKSLMVYSVEETLPGVPFYIKKGRLIHETSYLETLARSTLTAKKVTFDTEKKRISHEIDFVGAKTFSLSTTAVDLLAKIQENLAEARSALSIEMQKPYWDIARQNFEDLSSYTGQFPEDPLPIERNTIIDSNYVDYENIYYLNKLQPLSGSSELSIELAADGTLTKTTAKSEDSTLEKLLGLLPTADKLVDQLKLEPQEEEPEPEQNITGTEKKEITLYEFSLTVEYQFIRHIKYCEVDPYSQRSYRPPIGQDDETSWYRREIISDLDAKTEKPAAEAADQAQNSSK